MKGGKGPRVGRKPVHIDLEELEKLCAPYSRWIRRLGAFRSEDPHP